MAASLNALDDVAKFLEFEKIIPTQLLRQVPGVPFRYTTNDSLIQCPKVMEFTKAHLPLLTRDISHEKKESENEPTV